jgi:hypothetical protein
MAVAPSQASETECPLKQAAVPAIWKKIKELNISFTVTS